MNFPEFEIDSADFLFQKNNGGLYDQQVSMSRIREDVVKVYEHYCRQLTNRGIKLPDSEIDEIAGLIYGDLYARVDQDPIALSPEFIYSFSRSFHVIFYYRIANRIFYLPEDDADAIIYKACAFYLSEKATQKTAIEIHPEAIIGTNFVIDHGVNTVIGATSVIGNDCTILQNVVLGSRKITFNQRGKRHPTLGNKVHVSGGVRILGPVHIGDNTHIGPDCLITEDVPEGSVVKMERKQQVYRSGVRS